MSNGPSQVKLVAIRPVAVWGATSRLVKALKGFFCRYPGHCAPLATSPQCPLIITALYRHRGPTLTQTSHTDTITQLERTIFLAQWIEYTHSHINTRSRARARAHTHTHTAYARTRAHTHTHTHIHTYTPLTHTHTHTHTQTHTHAH